MSAMSDYLENKIIAYIFKIGDAFQPTTLGIALSAAPLSDTSTTLSGQEIGTVNGTTATGYARATLNPSSSGNWSGTTGLTSGSVSNSSNIVFATATANWVNSGGTEAAVTYAALCDSTTYNGGNVLFWGELSVSKTVNNGDVFQFSTGNFAIQIDKDN